MYQRVRRTLESGGIVILDGGTGTEIQRRGAPMHGETWCAEANRTHPDVVRSVHADYIRAGADVITANTFATSPLLFDALGRGDEIAGIDGAAIALARQSIQELGREGIAVAGSFSTMRPVRKGSDRTTFEATWTREQAEALMRGKAEALAEAGCDLILMEMMRDRDYSLWATEAAVATGLPVWVGISVERREDGALVGFGRPDCQLRDTVPALMQTGARACLIMHNEIAVTAEALTVVKESWTGPLGAYPESGFFEMPRWKFVDIVPEQRFVAECRHWRELGASILGGCCGIGPEHIEALAKSLKPQGVAA